MFVERALSVAPEPSEFGVGPAGLVERGSHEITGDLRAPVARSVVPRHCPNKNLVWEPLPGPGPVQLPVPLER